MRRVAMVVMAWLALATAPVSAQLVANDNATTTSRTIAVEGAPLAYAATVSSLALREGGIVKANMGYVAYHRLAPGERRPITFVFNGGPGASSVYLHLGGLGPRRIAFGDDGQPLDTTTLVDNAETWLRFTDLVFVDPVGTGVSQPAKVDDRPVATSEFWGVNQDLAWAARFVREYILVGPHRASAVFLVGESYGGFRVARLVDMLPRQYGVNVAGAILISPVLDFDLSHHEERVAPLATVLRLPSIAAAAWHHDLVARAANDNDARDRFLVEVEEFAIDTLLPALARGRALPAARRDAIHERLAALTGLGLESVRRADARVSREQFVREALAGRGRVLGRYDATITAPAPTGRRNDEDPTLQGLTPAFQAGIERLLRDELAVALSTNYVVLNGQTSRAWDWRTEGRGPAGGLSALGTLRSAMLMNRSLRLLIVHGLHDLVTPYFTSTYIVRQIALPPERLGDIALLNLDGGHMVYLRPSSRGRLSEAAESFYARLPVVTP
jgi:carboxypeptidase C (cathepsin A)